MNTKILLGVDTGGTFTDFVLLSDNQLRVHKVLSTPDAPERAILQGIKELGLALPGLAIVHGSTVATNALLERKGVRTAYITNRGFADVLSIGRQARKALYDLQPAPEPVPVSRDLCLETGGRIAASGEIIEPLTAQDLATLRKQLEALKPEAVAINLLFSFVDDRAEKAIENIVPEGVFVSRSSAVLAEYKEYERGICTWLNSYVGPKVNGYLHRLSAQTQPASLSVMQSNATTTTAASAAQHAVQLLLSGPAGGLMGAKKVAEATECECLLTFDMGGTSTDVALIDGRLKLTSEGVIGGFPVATPMVDMHTIGAGGGSIASVDAGGLLQVGPASAGASPGPACYGKGGLKATVTDANVVLGRLRPDAFLGGEMALDVAAATASVQALADELDCGLEDAAMGIVQLANEHMARALRVISVQRGVDPSDWALMCFGGAGGLHVCALAESMDMHRAIVPVYGGVLSALGMMAAPRGRDVSRSVCELFRKFTDDQILDRLSLLAAQAKQELLNEGLDNEDLSSLFSLDLRYQGQSFSLNVPWQSLAESEQAFHLAHEKRFGHRMPLAVELVNVRAHVSAPEPDWALPLIQKSPSQAENRVMVSLFGESQPVELWPREHLFAGQKLVGPVLVTEQVSTSFIAAGWQAEIDPWGNLQLEKC